MGLGLVAATLGAGTAEAGTLRSRAATPENALMAAATAMTAT
ncbi:MAG: hypothetical protein QOG10_6036, partial [Kribbellaceae bacterium]|nr:hypothetical protein [Kribbellaceae bacterium]